VGFARPCPGGCGAPRPGDHRGWKGPCREGRRRRRRARGRAGRESAKEARHAARCPVRARGRRGVGAVGGRGVGRGRGARGRGARGAGCERGGRSPWPQATGTGADDESSSGPAPPPAWIRARGPPASAALSPEDGFPWRTERPPVAGRNSSRPAPCLRASPRGAALAKAAAVRGGRQPEAPPPSGSRRPSWRRVRPPIVRREGQRLRRNLRRGSSPTRPFSGIAARRDTAAPGARVIAAASDVAEQALGRQRLPEHDAGAEDVGAPVVCPSRMDPRGAR